MGGNCQNQAIKKGQIKNVKNSQENADQRRSAGRMPCRGD